MINFKKRAGGNIHARGAQDWGKTLLLTHIYRYLIVSGQYEPTDCVGNYKILGPLGYGQQVLKGDDLRQWLWDCTHKPYRHKICLIDEIDSEFPARFFNDKEQTEIALRMWHNRKLGNYNLYSSHFGRGSDLIFDLATNFCLIPRGPNWENDTLEFTCINGLDLITSDKEAVGISKTAEMYDTEELTEDMSAESYKIRPSVAKRLEAEAKAAMKRAKLKRQSIENGLDINAEMAAI